MDEPPAKRIKLAENDASVDVKLTESLSNNAVETESKVEQTTNVDDVRQSDSGKENSLTKTKKKVCSCDIVCVAYYYLLTPNA